MSATHSKMTIILSQIGTINFWIGQRDSNKYFNDFYQHIKRSPSKDEYLKM